MKPAMLAQKLAPLLPHLRCPACHQGFILRETSLVCPLGHCFDLSSRGYVNLAPNHDQAGDKYDAALFDSRRAALDFGVYAPAIQAVADALRERFGDSAFSLADVGCGEGYYAREIARTFPSSTVVGLDLSRAAVRAAAREPGRAHWLVADLKRMPLSDGFADVVLDVLTPADYAAFRRLLKPGGVLVKLIPGGDHLREIRAAVRQHLRAGDSYDNARVMEHLQSNAHVLRRDTIRQTLAIPPSLREAVLRMTPMTFSVPPEALERIALSELTVHMEMLLCSL